MFLRFVISELHEESHKELGVFQAAFRLRDTGMLSKEEESTLQEIREWFNRNLEKPTRFTTAKPLSTENEKMESLGLRIQPTGTSTRYERWSHC